MKISESEFEQNQMHIIKIISEASENTNCITYLVGGLVRDLLLHKKSCDLDFVSSNPDKIVNWLKINYKDRIVELYKKDNTRFKSRIIQYKFGNINEKIDLVEPRAESYTKESIKPNVISGTFMDDVKRRDFTINALYISVNKNTWMDVVDMLTTGLLDLHNMILETPLDPDITFSDDPSRMLRCIRFAVSKKMNISLRVQASIRKNAHEILRVPAELIRAEIMKGCMHNNYFNIMHKVGLLNEIVPEVCKLINIHQRSDFHTEDAFIHTLLFVNNLPEDSLLRFAGLLHDIGKSTTTSKDGSSHGHEVESEKQAIEILQRLKFSNENSVHIGRLVRNHMIIGSFASQNPGSKGIRKFLNANSDILSELSAMTKADILSDSPINVRSKLLDDLNIILSKINEVHNNVGDIAHIKLSINGLDIMNALNIQPNDPTSRKMLIGQAQRSLMEQVIAGDLPNTPEALIAFVKNNYL